LTIGLRAPRDHFIERPDSFPNIDDKIRQRDENLPNGDDLERAQR